MASPQKENGFTPISNELLDAILKTNFTATQLKLVLCCCRYTYGFSRKEAKLSESYLNKATGISKRYISQELRQLIDLKVIIVIKESTYTEPRTFELNKNYETWLSRTTVPQVNYKSTDEPEQDTTVEPQFNTTVEPQFHQERKNIKKELKQDTVVGFFETIWSAYPKKEGKGSVSKTQKEKLFRIGLEHILRCIERYKKEKSGTDKQYLQMGSTFFNSGYVDYLDENYLNGQDRCIPKKELKFIEYDLFGKESNK